MQLQHESFEGDQPKKETAHCEWAESVLQAELSQQVITSKRRATRRLERSVAACVAAGVIGQSEAIKILIQVVSS